MPTPISLALGTVQSQANRYPIVWALLDLARRAGYQVQPFRSHAELASSPGAEVAAGRPYRHLDSEMLFPRLCGHLLAAGSQGCDLAVVDGRFNDRGETFHSLESLCESLELSSIVILNTRLMRDGHLPLRPNSVSCVLLDDVSSRAEAQRWQLEVEAIWKVPVAGFMPSLPAVRTVAEGLSGNVRPSPLLCRHLSTALAENCCLEHLLHLAKQKPPSASAIGRAYAATFAARSKRIALGLDEAMSRYFPENLDLLQNRGASLIDFSPLRAGDVPRDVEVIYLSDGCLTTYAPALARNHCLFASLRAHVRRGGLIYSEGMGAALLGRELILPQGERLRMSGVLPWSYRLLEASPVALCELTHQENNWLVQGCSRLRGYTGCSRLERVEEEISVNTASASASVHAWRGAVASTIPLFFPAHPRLARNLMRSQLEWSLT